MQGEIQCSLHTGCIKESRVRRNIRRVHEGYRCRNCEKELLSIKGVEEKVADFVLLFGLGKRSAFPVDVWIRRSMNDLYFDR